MFGLGGMLTEVLEDVVFRIAPLTSWDAREMIQEIRGRKILEPFRGEDAVDLEVLSQTLVALGEIGLQYQEVVGIDINPLKIRQNGKPVSVDALVVLKSARTTNT
jgi:acetyl-CoA synthetase (ADP-forming)